MLQPGKKLGPFVIEKELGSGAMGTVYRAQYKDQKKRVAIKVISMDIGARPTIQARFEREAEILKQLKHPHIVRLLATGRYKQSPFYAMEYIEGKTLEDALKERGRFSWEDVVMIGKQMCDALQHVHDAGIVHRDIKPSNIMMLPDGTVKLTDFGIAKDLDGDGLTATNHTVGTASYMSPEQCRGVKDITGKSDLYSLGVVLFELLTGRRPFEADSALDMFMKHARKPPPRPSQFVLDIPVWMDNLICQLLEKKPDNRPYNARLVADTLLQIKEKIETQESAGVMRAMVRNTERTKDMPKLDDKDKEIALTLLGKKKRKKKKPPIYQRGWFVSLAVLLILTAGGALFYQVFLRPPSLQSLYEQTAKLMKEGDFHSAQEARTQPLASFFYYYGNSDNEWAKQMRLWSDEADLTVYDYWLHRRRGMPPDDKGERTAQMALELEDKGNLPKALESWEELAKQKGADDKEKHGWGLVGEKYARDVARVMELVESLEKKPKDFEAASEHEKKVVEAVRVEQEEGMAAAKGLWEDLKRYTRDQPQHRTWYLLASYKLWMAD